MSQAMNRAHQSHCVHLGSATLTEITINLAISNTRVWLWIDHRELYVVLGETFLFHNSIQGVNPRSQDAAHLDIHSTYRVGDPTPRGLFALTEHRGCFPSILFRGARRWDVFVCTSLFHGFRFFEISSRFYIEILCFLSPFLVQDQDLAGRFEVGWTSGRFDE